MFRTIYLVTSQLPIQKQVPHVKRVIQIERKVLEVCRLLNTLANVDLE